MPTLLALKQGILRKLAWADDKVGLLPIPLSSTAKSADLLSLRDTKLARGTHSAGNYNGRHVEIASQPTKVDSGANINEGGAFAAGDTTLTVDDGTKFAVGDGIQIEDEILAITVIATHNLTVTRGIQGTTDVEHADGTDVYLIGPAVGEIAAVDDGGFDLTDKLTTSPALTALIRSGANYLLYPRKLVPETLEDAINGVLKKTEAPHLWAPSLVTDSDMGEADLTNWDAIGTPTTREFITTAAHVYFGPRSLHLADADTDAGAQTENFGVYDTENLLVSVLARVVLGTLNVILYRVTATAVAVKTVTLSLREPQFSEVRFREAVPSGMRQGRLHFVAPEDNCEFYISPHVIVQSDRRRSYAVPSWLVSESQMVEMVQLPLGASADDDDSYIPLSSELTSALGLSFIRSDRDVNPLRIELGNPGSAPVYLLCKRPFAELSALTDTTPCDEEFVVAKAAARILKNRGDEGWWMLEREAEQRARKMRYGGRELRSESPTVLV